MNIDKIDRLLLKLLAQDARLSIKSLSEQVGLSAPATAERVRSLEENHIIEGFSITINLEALGYPLMAIVRVKPLAGQLHYVQKLIQQMPECSECDKVTGEDCFVMRLQVRSMQHLDEILDPIADYAQCNTSLVKATPVKRRLPPL